MDEELYLLHLVAGRVSGKGKTCDGKAVYADEALALCAATAHNRWKERRHDVEPYPCVFCGKWHVGGVMPRKVLESFAESFAQTEIEMHLAEREKGSVQ